MVPRLVATLGLLVLAVSPSCSCSDLDPVLAAEGGVCVGTPVPCESFAEAEACRRQLGCYWIYLGGRCEPNSAEGPHPCERFADPEACVAQLGCWWR